MNKALAEQFLTRYEEAATRREKALALYNAMVVSMPKEAFPAFLGDASDAFLAFIKTLQNEDADISTAVAYEKDAPCKRYLNTLYTHMERLGLIKDTDWIEYQVMIPDKSISRIDKIFNYVSSKEKYEVVTYTDRKTLYKEAFEAFALIDRAYAKLYGTVPLTDEVIRQMIRSYIPLVNLKYICAVKDKSGRIVAFGILVPSIAKALKRSNGKLLPLGIIRLLRALKGKNDTLEMFLVAVEPELQMQGVSALVVHTLLEKLIENGVKYCETGPTLETNGAVHSLWGAFENRQHKRRRCYIKNI